jgi:hypothetical protein
VVSIDGHIIIPIDPKRLYQLLAQDFWDRVSSMTEVAGRQASWVWGCDQGLTVSAHDRLERWGVRSE